MANLDSYGDCFGIVTLRVKIMLQYYPLIAA